MYFKPKNLEEILIQGNFEDSTYLAGGTDIVPLIKNGVKSIKKMIDLSSIEQFHKVEVQEDGIYIGAMVTLDEIGGNINIHKYFPALKQAADATASKQIRNIGTVAGNIMQDRRCIYFNQSDNWRSSIEPCFKTGGCICYQIKTSPVCKAIYYSDIATSLYLYDAKVEIIESGTKKIVTIQDLIEKHSVNNGTTKNLKILITKFILPYTSSDTISLFKKISVRSSIDFPTINFAAKTNKGNSDVKIIVGAVSHLPIELTTTEEMINSKETNIDIIAEAAVSEINKKSNIVKEATISTKVKRDSFKNIELVLKELLKI